MRRLLIFLAAIAFFSAPSWADSIDLNVNAWVIISASSSTCFSNCTETLAVNFLYAPPSIQYESGEIVPGSMSISSSGFLGTFSAGPVFSGYIPFWDAGREDEIDLDWSFNQGLAIQPGTNTLFFNFWSCESVACGTALGGTWPTNPDGLPAGITGGIVGDYSIVTPVAVPDGTSFLSLAVATLAAFGIGWRWRNSGGGGWHRGVKR